MVDEDPSARPCSSSFQTGFVQYSLFRAPSISSVASDETLPNLPGPGRNLGRLYDALGDRLVGVLSKAYTRGRLSSSTEASTVDHDRSYALHIYRIPTASSVETNATAPNLPGPGRNLGQLYDWLGLKFESYLTRLLVRRGLGPEAVAAAISRLRQHERFSIKDLHISDQGRVDGKSRRLAKYCKKLFKYSKSGVLQTQLQALDRVTALAVYDPYLRRLMGECLANERLSTSAYDEDALLASSSKALISISETSLNKVMSDFYVKQDITAGSFSIFEEFWDGLQSCLTDPTSSFLAIRHLNQVCRLFSSKTHSIIEGRVASTIYRLVASSPEFIEWTEFDKFLDVYFNQMAPSQMEFGIGAALLR
ncbi:hypothetical protein SCHPADRAFT_943664 [Schizopora paradoxa]|uniref:Uncharacterized protein n=1 Tax=Schizopora paradoxa TaxID=27342 RepID=A0A0H2RCC1_9AGAM|nr:hypothetical protein SCHPADRAFT_943664 [Schizopora paradoxa]